MHILVIGAGAIGFQLSKQLSQDGHDITQIDTDPSRVKRVSEQLDIIVAEGNGTSLQDLRGLGIEQVDLVAAMTTNDEVNLLACRMAKKLGVESTIAPHPQSRIHCARLYLQSPRTRRRSVHPPREGNRRRHRPPHPPVQCHRSSRVCRRQARLARHAPSTTSPPCSTLL